MKTQVLRYNTELAKELERLDKESTLSFLIQHKAAYENYVVTPTNDNWKTLIHLESLGYEMLKALNGQRKQNGYTLIEWMIAMAIVSILVMLAIAGISKAVHSSNETANTIQTNVEESVFEKQIREMNGR